MSKLSKEMLFAYGAHIPGSYKDLKKTDLKYTDIKFGCVRSQGSTSLYDYTCNVTFSVGIDTTLDSDAACKLAMINAITNQVFCEFREPLIELEMELHSDNTKNALALTSKIRRMMFDE